MKLRPLFQLLLVLLLGASLGARADERFQPKTPSQLPVDSTSDLLYHVPGAQVVYANYELIRKDFKQTEKMSDEQINHWLVENFAYVSESQLRVRGLWTTHFEPEYAKTKLAHRPPNYIRAGMIEADGGGMADVKGIGYPPGEKVDQIEEFTNEWRAKLKDAKKRLNQADNDEDRKKAQSEISEAEANLSHRGANMRLGEALAETYKQESLQHVANRFNQETIDKGYDRPRIETVETYFVMALPWKAKSASGEGPEEEVSLYGRQPTAGHGRGSDVSPDIAYNPSPGAGYNPSDDHRRYNALQISNSGAVFDYGSLAVTDPEVRASHGYRNFTQDAIERGAYFDLFDSDINNFSYDTARDLVNKLDSWGDKRSWVRSQRSIFVPLEGPRAAQLTGRYGRLASLYRKASEKRFGEKESRELLQMISESNTKTLGSDFLSDTMTMKTDRIDYLRMQTILSALDLEGARTLLREAIRFNDRRVSSGSLAIKEFLGRLPEVVGNHTEGMGDVPVLPTYALWDALRESKSKPMRVLGRKAQYENLLKSWQSGGGNAILEGSFLRDLGSSDRSVSEPAVAYLYHRAMLKETGLAKRLLAQAETQDALVQAYQSNRDGNTRMKILDLLSDEASVRTPASLELLKSQEAGFLKSLCIGVHLFPK